jgi:hypothetical protein
LPGIGRTDGVIGGERLTLPVIAVHSAGDVEF